MATPEYKDYRGRGGLCPVPSGPVFRNPPCRSLSGLKCQSLSVRPTGDWRKLLAIGASIGRWTILVEDEKPFPVDAATATSAELAARFIARGMRHAGPIIRLVRDDGKDWIPGSLGQAPRVVSGW